MNCIGVAKEVVQITKDFLIRSGQENSQYVLLAIVERMQRQTRFRSASANDVFNLDIRVTRQLLNRSATLRLFIEPVDGQYPKRLLECPTLRQRP